MPVNSDIFLQQLRQQIIEVRTAVETRFSGKNDASLQLAPAPGKWSAIQCLEHLNTYGRYYLPALERAIEQALKNGDKATPRFRSGWLGAKFTKMMQPQENGMPATKMQSPRGYRPALNLPVAPVLAEFIEQQRKMEALLVKAGSVNLMRSKVATTLSRFIRMSVGDTFGFMTAHIRRHVAQAERALAAASEHTVSV
ncbi:DinB family protein [Chitinophaga vietnamensis]|uniref:DinB family protein n=1 Tax=Chitinophaga vietnamensis TaxID=2593957 RepID=UPI00117738B7|nr:DinB family protein [Chitinophaga vietnamensis]